MNSVNKTLINWLNNLDKFSFKNYEELPDIDLYMDQMVTFLEKQLNIFQTSTLDKQITPSMINNYVKGEVITAPIAKKYNREHLALIEEVCTLKQVLTIAEVKQILDDRYKTNDAIKQDIFNNFKDLVNEKNHEAITFVNNSLENIENNDLNELTNLALNLACTANAYITIAKRILFLNKLHKDQINNQNK